MASKTVKFDKQGVQTIINGLMRPLKLNKQFFNVLGIFIDRDKDMAFRMKGARSGMPKWKSFNNGRGIAFYDTKRGSTTRTSSGKWRKRPGTDGSKTRRYSLKSRLLQASGGFKNSFKVIRSSRERLIYGSNLRVNGEKIADKIMSNPSRPVLFVTNDDNIRYTRLYRNFINENIKF